MKAEQIAPPRVFKPVQITLETQEEVDKIYAVLNYHPIVDILEINGWWKAMENFRSKESDKYHEMVCKKFTIA